MSRDWPPHGLWEDPRQQPEPWPPQDRFNPRGEFQNPGNTLPYPAPKSMPLGLWNGTPTQMVWSAGFAPFLRQTSWQSPVFDLRPSYRNARGTNDTDKSIPIWKPSTTNPGAGGKLWVQLGPMQQPVSLVGMEIFYEEYGHIQDGNNPQLISPQADITDQYVPGQEACVLGFWPPGDGYPVRFWSVRIIIKLRLALASDPRFVIQGAYY
jgi:hypothetical protein